MKRCILLVLAGAVLVAFGMYVTRSQNTATSPQDSITEEPVALTIAEEPHRTESTGATTPSPETVDRPAQPGEPSTAPPSASSAAVTPNPALDAALVSRTVDALVSSQVAYQQKRDVWKQLREAGKLDQVIADLEQRTTNETRGAEIPAALGQAYLQKCATIQDMRDQGILAMQADKAFDAALSLDTSNWEARFTKAVAMSYWPPMLNKSDEVIQHFQTLIQQQETQTPQPHFAESYAWLGDQYQKAGRTEDSLAIWQRGASLFPSDEKLQKKLAPAH
jgi:hypothetical protein